jgi:hypothetical protein
MTFSMIVRARFARGRLSLVKGGRTDGSELKFEVPKVPKVIRKCHPEAKAKDLAKEKEILHFAALRSE